MRRVRSSPSTFQQTHRTRPPRLGGREGKSARSAGDIAKAAVLGAADVSEGAVHAFGGDDHRGSGGRAHARSGRLHGRAAGRWPGRRPRRDRSARRGVNRRHHHLRRAEWRIPDRRGDPRRSRGVSASGERPLGRPGDRPPGFRSGDEHADIQLPDSPCSRDERTPIPDAVARGAREATPPPMTNAIPLPVTPRPGECTVAPATDNCLMAAIGAEALPATAETTTRVGYPASNCGHARSVASGRGDRRDRDGRDAGVRRLPEPRR